MELLEKNYIERYFNDCILRKRLSQKTIRMYKIDLNQYFDFMDQSKKINQYIYYLNTKYTKHKTIKRKIASITAFYSYLEYEELKEYSPFNKIRTVLKEPKKLPKIIQKKDLKMIIEYLSNKVNESKTLFQKTIAIRNMTMILMLLSTGIRISELCNIKKENINFNDKCLIILGKGAKERIIYLGNDQVLQLCQKYIELNQQDNDYLFLNKFNKPISDQTVRLILKNIEKSLKLHNHITPHLFRHTFATTLLEKDVDIRYIQSILGHSSISTTQIYTHVTYLKQKEILSKKNPSSDYQINMNNLDE